MKTDQIIELVKYPIEHFHNQPSKDMLVMHSLSRTRTVEDMNISMLHLVERLIQEKIIGEDIKFFNCLLDRCLTRSELDKIIGIIEERKLSFDKITMSILTKKYKLFGDESKILETTRIASEQGLLSKSLLVVLMDYFASNGNGPNLISVYVNVIKQLYRTVPPDLIKTFIQSLLKVPFSNDCLELVFSEMQQVKDFGDEFVAVAIEYCIHGSRNDFVDRIWETLKTNDNFKAGTRSLNVLLNYWNKNAVNLEIIEANLKEFNERFPNTNYDAVTFGTLMNCYSKHGTIEKSLSLLQAYNERMKIYKDPIVYCTFLTALVKFRNEFYKDQKDVKRDPYLPIVKEFYLSCCEYKLFDVIKDRLFHYQWVILLLKYGRYTPTEIRLKGMIKMGIKADARFIMMVIRYLNPHYPHANRVFDLIFDKKMNLKWEIEGYLVESPQTLHQLMRWLIKNQDYERAKHLFVQNIVHVDEIILREYKGIHQSLPVIPKEIIEKISNPKVKMELQSSISS
jgi:hypothetical protein